MKKLLKTNVLYLGVKKLLKMDVCYLSITQMFMLSLILSNLVFVLGVVLMFLVST